MDRKNVLDLIDEFKSGLLSQATDGNLSEPDYKRMRESLFSIPEIQEHIPQIIKSNRSSSDFRRYMQTKSDTYKGRREIIDNEMNTLSEFVEFSEDLDPFSGIKEYTKCERIGKGGFGEVFRYHNDFLDMDFAVKIYQPMFVSDDEKVEGEKRFFREAKILFSLNHENIVRIYDAGRIEGSPFIRMELIDGKSLDKYCDEYGQLDYNSALLAILQILRGLEYAHNENIIHRDLKPSNIIVTKDVTKQTYKIIDFGVSAFLNSELYTKLTKTGEQIAGGQFIDPLLGNDPQLRDVRSDIYSVGAILYYMICGRTPAGSDFIEMLHKTSPDVSSKLESIITKSLSSDIQKRYSSCSEMAAEVKDVLRAAKTNDNVITGDEDSINYSNSSRLMILNENLLKTHFFEIAVKYSIEKFLESDPQIGFSYELAGAEDCFEFDVRDLLYRAPMLSNSICFCDIVVFVKILSYYHSKLTEYTEFKNGQIIATNPFNEYSVEKGIMELQELRKNAIDCYNNLKAN